MPTTKEFTIQMDDQPGTLGKICRPLVQWCIYIGPDEGCHDVPEPIAPMDITFVSLEPTLIRLSPHVNLMSLMSWMGGCDALAIE
jgi:hypothetical protein